MIYSIIVGGTAGWLAGKIFKGKGFGFLINIIVGIIGGIIGNWTFNAVGISAHGFIGNVITGVVGAGILIWGINILKGR